MDDSLPLVELPNLTGRSKPASDLGQPTSASTWAPGSSEAQLAQQQIKLASGGFQRRRPSALLPFSATAVGVDPLGKPTNATGTITTTTTASMAKAYAKVRVASHRTPATAAVSAVGAHRRRCFSLHCGSLWLLRLLVTIGVLIAALDVLRQTSANAAAQQSTPIDEDWEFVFSDKTWVVGICYVILIVIVLALSLNRVVTVRNAEKNIPKFYVPIREDDLPRSIFKQIHRALVRVRRVNLDPVVEENCRDGWFLPAASPPSAAVLRPHLSSPSLRDHTKSSYQALSHRRSAHSLSKTGGDHVNNELFSKSVVGNSAGTNSHSAKGELLLAGKPLHLKRAVIQSWLVIQTAVRAAISRETSSDPADNMDDLELHDVSNEEDQKILRMERGKPDWMAVSQYLQIVCRYFGIHESVCRFFIDAYEKARFSGSELDEIEYRDAMKCLAIILKRINRHYSAELLKD